ncbi:MAG: glycosyltransferase [Longimicrobiales bacterium]
MTPDVSVVIPTLGGAWVADTIARLNAGTVVPREILVCVPEGVAHGAAELAAPPNVRIVATPCRGQVAQRAHGFGLAEGPWVLQLDDDIWLERDCLETLVDFAAAHPGVAVGPAYHDRVSGAYHSFRSPRDGRPSGIERVLFRVINGADGYQPGQVGVSGVNMGVPRQGDWLDLGWLPGGCVLHRKEGLVHEAFYPFPGKAFAEDLFHSRLLRKQGVRLARCGAARCTLELSLPEAQGVGSVLRGQRAYARAMRHFVRLEGGSLIRLHLYFALNWLELFWRRVTRSSRLPAARHEAVSDPVLPRG